MADKRCGRCVQVKPTEEFPIQRASSSGRSPWCRDCHALAKREYRQRHGERLKAAGSRWGA